MYASSDHRDWAIALSFVTFADNYSRQDTAGYSHFYLLFGREPSLPFETLLSTILDSPTAYTQDVIATAIQAHQIARIRLSASQTRQKCRYDECIHEVHYEPGALVLVWHPNRRVGLSDKFLSRYYGPYRILGQVTPVTYEVFTLDATVPSPLYDIIQVSRLKPYLSETDEPHQ
ncbi:uncharacterized protein [Dermacentor albipictus]|uniref:uncharacterized protein n=1 Tax=Dermacentor albipictus TaxID=60249 RepID=UPI0038FC7E1D